MKQCLIGISITYGYIDVAKYLFDTYDESDSSYEWCTKYILSVADHAKGISGSKRHRELIKYLFWEKEIDPDICDHYHVWNWL